MEMMQIETINFFKCNNVNKKSAKDIWKNYCTRMKSMSLEEKKELIKSKNKGNVLSIVKSRDELKEALDRFIDTEIDDLQTEGAMCLQICDEEDNYNMTSYWIGGVYTNVENFLKDNYSEILKDIIIGKYPNDLAKLENKIAQIKGKVTDSQLIIEVLATILLHEYQYISEWYTVYGTEEEDMIDFNKYEFINAYYDKEEFPIIKSEDIVAAMYGINFTVQPSDLYNVFAYYSDELKMQKEKNMFDLDIEEHIFTPDPFLVVGVEARWKNYVDLIKNTKSKTCCIDYALKFNQLNLIEDNHIRNLSIIASAIDDYMNRYSTAPNSLPILREMIRSEYKINTFEITYSIRGVKNKKNCWSEILKKVYDVPLTPEEYQNLIISMATDFKKELNGIQKKANSTEEAYYGKYPNKDSATHGLKFIKDLSVHIKNRRGLPEKKVATPNFSLSLAEKQSTYLIKKILRYTRNNPILSTSFGIDSTVTQHLLRRVAKHSYYLVNNNSLVEYPELIKFRNKMIKKWNLENRITITKPVKSYWELQKTNGWNWERKGDRRNGISASEQCCYYIKHLPMYNFIDKLIEDKNPMEVNFTGLRAGESRQRSQQVLRDNVVYYAKSWKSLKVSPIAFFTDEMIWEYVKKYSLDYCEVYDKLVYYEDVFDNVSEDEFGKVIYRPRIGCWPCALVNTKSYYLYFLRKHYIKQYNHLMINKGMAKDLFIMGAKKDGIIPADFSIVKENKVDNNQLSLFDTYIEVKEENQIKDPFKNLSSEDILKNYSIESMEYLIMKRPCKFIG